jgi:hypothetical protein
MLSIVKKETKRLKETCTRINNKCIQECNCYIKDDNIVRIFNSVNLLNWEIGVYLYLVDYKLCPLIDVKNSEIVYILDDYVSVRNYLKSKNKKKETITLLLNELFSFINTFKKYEYIHGNLHIDNIFIKKKTYPFKFVIIDYSNSYIFNIKDDLNLKKTSFLAEYDKKEININFLKYWDFLTMYASLIKLYKKNINYLFIVQELINIWIPNNILNEFQEYLM